MASAKSWTLQHFHGQIKASGGGWKSKIPGMGGLDAVKQMKEMQTLLEAAMEVVGSGAGALELKDLGKIEKVSVNVLYEM